MGHRFFVISFVALLSPFWLGAAADPASAQETSEGVGDEDPADDEEGAIRQARADFQRAIELEQARDFAGALKLFRQVGQVKMTPQVRYHIATCEENLGRMVAALGGYRLALQDSAGMHPGFIEEVQRSIEYLEQRIPKLIVERGSGAEAARIELDGVQLGAKSIGIEVPLDPGPHAVTASAPGYQDHTSTVTMSEGQTEELLIELLPVAEPVADVVAPPPPPPPPPRGYGVAPQIIGGVGLAVVATGAVFLGVSLGKSGEAEAICGGTVCMPGLPADELERARELVNSAKSLEATGWVMMGLGVSGIAAGTILYFTDPARRARNREAAGVRFQLSAARADVGLSFSGRF